MKVRSLVGVVLFAIVGLGLSAQAQSTAWTNQLSGNWSVAGNWNPNMVPGPTTNVYLTNTTTAAYIVTNDVANNAIGSLIISSPNIRARTLFCAGNGLTGSGAALIGTNAILTISNAIVSFASSVAVSNAGIVYVKSNAFLNVGGTDQASANASSVTLTNFPGGIIELGQPGVVGSTGTLNASTSFGIVNQGTIRTVLAGNNSYGNIRADVFNDTNGFITTGAQLGSMTIHSVSTNRGRISSTSNTSIVLTNGNVNNEGVIESPGVIYILNGALINASSGKVLIYFNANAGVTALSTLNYGSMIISNSSPTATKNMGGPVTNYGSIVLYRNFNNVNLSDTVTATNILNYGVIQAVGTYGVAFTNAIVGSVIRSPVTNQIGGVIISTNGSVLVLTNMKNNGTLVVHSNSVLAIGYDFGVTAKVKVGTLTFTNNGAISLQGGSFGVLLLTNSVEGTVQGQGEIGHVTLSNLVSATQQTTNFVRFFAVRSVVNSGRIAPSGIWNVGSVTNLSGGIISGIGNFRSIDTTNYYTGETLVTTTLNRDARIHNAAGGVILADGGTLALENGFVSNTQFGTIGATNGGVLRIGDGSQALTNRGTIWLSNGTLVGSDLTVTNGTVSVDLAHLATTTDGVVQTTNLTLTATSTLALTGFVPRAVLIRYTGTRTGTFGATTGLPPGYIVSYGTAADGTVSLVPGGGTMILVR